MSYWKEIYTYEQLHSIIKNGVITESFWVSNSSVNKLLGVKEIKIGPSGIVHFKNLTDIGDLEYIDCEFSFWGNINSLKKLKFVGGTLRFGAPIRTLGNLREVEGDLRPTTNELEDLGELVRVGGTADFRGMIHLKQLGKLKEVGENLNLVKSLKEKYDLAKISVKGRIVFWNKPSKYYQDDSLIKDRTPPPWEYVNPYEFEKYLVKPAAPQLEFYEYFKSNFQSGVFVDVGGMRNYVRYFIYEQLQDYHRHQNFDILAKTFQGLKEQYPELSHDADRIEIAIGRELGIQEYLDKVLYHEKFLKWDEFIRESIGENPHAPDVKSDYYDDVDLLQILKIGFKQDTLTDFGRKNVNSILSNLITAIRRIEEAEKEPFARRFFDKGQYYKAVENGGAFNSEYYKAFFESEESFNEKLNLHNQRSKYIPDQNKQKPNYFPYIVIFAIESYFKTLARDSENFVRENRGLPKIGEGWINETNLFYRIKDEFAEHEVVHQGRPKWLGLQRFDVYFPNENIAIEYQGAQHYEAIDYFGGEEGLKQTVDNDRIKMEKCIKNDCILIEVFPEYDFDEVKKRIIDSIHLKKQHNK